MNNKLPEINNLEELNKKELKNLVKQLQFELKGEKHLTKKDILEQLLTFKELGLNQDDLMNVEQDYNMSLRKSGWMKIYRFTKEHTNR